MKNTTKHLKYSHTVTWLALFSLVVSIFTGLVSGDRASAQNILSGGNRDARASANRVSPDLQKAATIARATGREETIKVILQVNGPLTGKLSSLLNRNGVRITAHFLQLSSYAVELPVSVVAELASCTNVTYVSLDREVKSLGHVSKTTGAEAVMAQTTLSPNGTPTHSLLDGSGVGIAVVDSGIYKEHLSFLGHNGISRVIINRDFTGENRVDDPYGHGTHVASIAAGNWRISNGAYMGRRIERQSLEPPRTK